MNALRLPDWIADLIGRCVHGGPDVRLLEATWEWQPSYSATLLVLVLLGLWVITLAVHRSRRLELPWTWRLALGLLRGAILAVPVVMLLQPALSLKFERIKPKKLAFLVDRSGSMSVHDGARVTSSRWQSAVESILPVVKQLREPGESAASGGRAMPPVQATLSLFDEKTEPAPWNDLQPSTVPAAERQTAIGSALRSARASLAGDPNASVVLVSDGADNSSPKDSDPVSVARDLGREGIAVHTVVVGNERAKDLAAGVTVEAPFAFAGDPVPLQVRIEHVGFDGASATVTVHEGDHQLAQKEVTLPSGGQPVNERIEVKFDTPGKKQCRIEVTQLPGELTAVNNSATAEVQVLDQKLRVLYIEHWPRWQYRFLRNAFQRDARYQVRLVLLTEDMSAPPEERQTGALPASAEEFSKFDTIVIGEVARQDLSPQQWQWIRDCVVNEGAGVIFIAGPAYDPGQYMEPPIADLLPFERVTTVSEEEVSPFRPVPTTLGQHHPLTRLGAGDDLAQVWRQLPALQWYAGVKDLKPGAIALVERQPEAGGDATPLFVLQRSGRGSALFVGTDETWKWRYQVGNQYFYGFWGRAIQHVGMPHRVNEFRTVRIEPAMRTVPRDMAVQVSVALDATAASQTSGPLKLVAERKGGGMAPASFEMRPSTDSPLVFQGELRMPAEGTYRLYVEGRDGQGDSTIEVKTTGQFNPELAAPAVNADLLRRIAEAGGGKSVAADQLPKLISQLDLAPLRFRWTERRLLWDGWILLLAMTLLLTLEWVLRKLRYLP